MENFDRKGWAVEAKWAQVVLAVSLCIASIRFSVAYCSYLYSIFALFAGVHYWISKKNDQPFFPQINNIGLSILGMGLFYGSLMLSAVVLLDRQSVKMVWDMFLFCIPFFAFWFIASVFDTEKGFKIGLLTACFILCIHGITSSTMGRMQSFFKHPNAFGVYFELTLPLLGYWLVKEKTWKKLMWGAAILLSVYCLWKTGSRGAILSLAGAAVLSGVVCVLGMIRQRRAFSGKKVVFIFLLTSVCIFGGISGVVTVNEQRVSSKQQEFFSKLPLDQRLIIQYEKLGGERAGMVIASWHMWENHKIWGIGMSRWGECYYLPSYHPAGAHEMGHVMPHNMPVYFFSGAGIFGGISYLLFMVLMFINLLKELIKNNDWLMTGAVLIAYIAFSLHGFLDATISNKNTAVIFFSLMGYYLGYCNRKQIGMRRRQ